MLVIPISLYQYQYPFNLLTAGTVLLYFSDADPDPGSGLFLTSRSGMGQKNRIRDEHFGSYFRELQNNIVWLKYLNLVTNPC